VDLSGEAYFEGAKNNQQPFTVQAGGMQVAVLGTQFDIEAYTDEKGQKATLLEGSVRVSAGDQQSLLQPGQQARIDDESNRTLRVVTPKKAADVIAWKNGLFLFREDSIQSVMRQVARWYDVDVVYHGKTDQDFFGKIPRNVPVSTLLKILESTGSVHFTIEGKKIIVDP
jgi:ferric-dicitrate binding protein FerR (iron transport regulator)